MKSEQNWQLQRRSHLKMLTDGQTDNWTDLLTFWTWQGSSDECPEHTFSWRIKKVKR